MTWYLIALPLLGAYSFVDWCLYTRLLAQRRNPLGDIGVLAVWLLIFSHLIVHFAQGTPFGVSFQSLWYSIVPNTPLLGTAFLAFFLGPTSALVINVAVSKNRGRIKQYAVEQSGEYLIGLLSDAALTASPVVIGIAGRKIYMALVAAAPGLERDAYVVLLPIFEGYLDKDTLAPQWTKTSRWWRESVREMSLEVIKRSYVIVPVKSIENAQLADLDQLTGVRQPTENPA